MKTYEVTVVVTAYQVVTVTANTEEEAEDMAEELMDVSELTVVEKFTQDTKEKRK